MSNRDARDERLLDRIRSAVDNGKKIQWGMFSGSPSGFAGPLPVEWLVWTTDVSEILHGMPTSPIRSSIEKGLGTVVTGYPKNHFDVAHKSILNGLLAQLEFTALKIPASDRVVSLGHNSPPQVEVAEKIDELTELLRTTNEFPGSDEEKDQILGELFAGKSLLHSDQVRVSAVRETIGSALRWLMEKAAGSVVGRAAGAVWDYIAGHWHNLL